MTDLTNPSPGGTAEIAGHTVARIGYGAMQLARLSDNREAAARVLRSALDLGVNHIDTAQFYGGGFVNSVIRDTVRPGDAVVVVTKVGSDPTGDAPFFMRAAQRPEELRESVKVNLEALGLAQIPVVNLRRMDVGPSLPLSPEQVVDIDDQLASLIALRDEGLIGAISVSCVSLENLKRALPAGIVGVQNAYSLVSRGDEALLELATENGLAWVPFFPLGGAFPGLPKVADKQIVHDIAAALDATPAQVGLAWILQHSANTLLIPGTASVDHLEANVSAGTITLDADQIAQLDAIPTRIPALPRH